MGCRRHRDITINIGRDAPRPDPGPPYEGKKWGEARSASFPRLKYLNPMLLLCIWHISILRGEVYRSFALAGKVETSAAVLMRTTVRPAAAC